MRTRTELVSRSGKQYTQNSIGSVLGSVFIGNEENVSPGVPDIHLKKKIVLYGHSRGNLNGICKVNTADGKCDGNLL